MGLRRVAFLPLLGLLACSGEAFSGGERRAAPEAGAGGDAGDDDPARGGSTSGTTSTGGSASTGGSTSGAAGVGVGAAGAGGMAAGGSAGTAAGSSSSGASGTGVSGGGGSGARGGTAGSSSGAAGSGGGEPDPIPSPCPGGTLVTLPYLKCIVARGRFLVNAVDACSVQGQTPTTCAVFDNIGQFDKYPETDGPCSTVNRCENPGYVSLRAQDGYTFTTTEHDVVNDACPVTCD